MARKFLVPIDLTKNELQNAVIQNLVGSPSSPVAGQIYFDSTANVLYYYNGSGWINAGGMVAGALSARPSAGAGNVGTFYYATDNKLMYYSDGSTWTQTQQFGAVSNLGSSGSNGTANEYSRADHVHRHSNTDHSAINLSALTVPTANVSWGNYKITNLATPTADGDAANKGYVDNAVAGLAWKQSANLLATAEVPLTGTTGSVVIDSHAALTSTHNGYRLLLLGQSPSSVNGIYTYTDNGTTYTLARSTDADVYSELIGASVFIMEGTVYGSTSWVQSNHYITSFSGQDWVQFSGTGTYTAGAGLALDGTIFNVGTASTARIVVNSDNIDLATVSQTNSTGNTSSNIVQSVTVDSYGRVTGVTSGTHTLAGTSAAGIASFNSGNFIVESGAITARNIGITATNVTVSTTSIALGNSLTISIPQDISTTAGVQFGSLGIGTTTPGTGITVANGKTALSASATSYASLNLPTGTQPSSPIQGDIWAYNNDLLYRGTSATRTVMFEDSSVKMTQATGTLAVANGGTGTTSFTTNGVLYGDGTSAVLVSAGPTATGQVLISGATTSAPIFGALNLSLSGTSVTGKLTVANGGTGATTEADVKGNLGYMTRYTTDVGTGSTTSVTVTHNFGTRDVTVQVYDNSSPYAQIECDVNHTSTTAVTLVFAAAPTSNQYRVVVIG